MAATTLPHLRGYVTLPTGQIHYREMGSGPALVLLHQTAMSGRQFERIMAILAPDFRCIALDSPGFGNSDYLPGEPEVADYAHALLGAIDAIGADRFSLLGHHTGASFAVGIASIAPDRVEKLILHSCPSGDAEFLQRKLDGSKGIPIREDGGHVEFLRRHILNYTSPFEPRDLHDSLAEYLRAGEKAHLAHRAIWKQNVRAIVPSLAMPVLFLSGERDDFVAEHEILAPTMPNARTHVFAGQGRMAMNEDPAGYAAEVRAFLKG